MKILSLLPLFFSCIAYAGGSIGGGSGGFATEELATLAGIGLERLPKVFVDQDHYRRANARLSTPSESKVFVDISGKATELKKLKGSIVNEEVTFELLPF